MTLPERFYSTLGSETCDFDEGTEDVDSESSTTFDTDFDSDQSNPYNWSVRYKWSLTILISAMSFSVNLAILMSAPATPKILQEFECDDPLYGTLLVSIWELGEVFGPLLWAPLSEMYGRVPVYHGTTFLFVIFSIAAAQSTSIQMLIGFRFLLGVSVASLVLNPCIVGDMFRPEQRGKALSVMGVVPYVAPCLGPILGGGVSEALGWRWTFRLIAIVTGSLEVILLFLLHETYSVTISRTRGGSRKETLITEVPFGADERNTSEMTRLRRSIIRPIVLMVTTPVLPLLSICGSIGMSNCYVVITSLTDIFSTTYGFSESIVGFSYMGLGLGMMSGIVAGGLLLDRLYNRYRDSARPESRLPVIGFAYLVIPLGLLLFGWTARPSIHWVLPVIATFFVGFGFTAMTLASWAYLIDSFGIFAASATAAVTVVRNAASATLPLAGPPLTSKLGLGVGYTIIALIGFVLSPVVLVLIRYGRRLRVPTARSLHTT